MTLEKLQISPTEQIRDAASDHWRDRDWPALLQLEDRLRQDPLWTTFWCALCAVGARLVGRDDARELLLEAVRGRFLDVRLLRPDLEEAFGADEDWPQIAAAIAANQPAQPFTLTSWPVQEPMWPLNLCRLTGEREEILLSRLPQRGSGAWETALSTLVWTATRWDHANHRVPAEDAVEILDLVADGGRFACPEFAVVLSQALNAHRIPARYARLLLATHHGGIGRAHRVAEAWIDDLAKWVVLDGQNGLYWCDGDGTPLGLAELRERHRLSGRRPDAVCLVRPIMQQRLDAWWDHFSGPSITAGRLWASGDLGLMCEGQILASEAVQQDGRGLHPRLDVPRVGVVVAGDRPALALGSAHPYPTGFYVRAATGTGKMEMHDPTWRFEQAPPGEHTLEIGVITDYGELPAHLVGYQTA